MKRLIASLACVFLVSELATAQPRPNIILIIADDLGYGDLSCYGQKKFNTPNIDKLATSGMRFTNFYSGTSVCAPSRSSLLSGQHTGHTFIRGNKEIYPEGQQPISDSVFTIAENLKKAGYVTGAFGKWGLGFVGSEGEPGKQGFDTFYGYNCQRESHRYYPGHLWNNRNKIILEANQDLKYSKIYAPDLIQKEALSFIEHNRKNRFFLYLPYTLPHAELLVPEDSIFARFDGKFPEIKHTGENYGTGATPMGYTSQDKPHATFAAMVARLDIYVGQVANKLKELGLDSNTIIVFSSDNGPHTEGGADPLFFNSSGGLRGVKRDLYEGGIRVPLIVRWPGKIKANTESKHISAFWDLFPTFSEIAGAPPLLHGDGISFWPVLSSENRQKEHAFLYWEFHEMGGRQAVRKGKWKGVKQQVKSAYPVFELYNLETDEGETTNLASQYPGIVKDLQETIKNSHRESTVFPLF